MPKQSSNVPSLKDLLSNDNDKVTQNSIRPDDFEWIEIPAGKVTITPDHKGYLPRQHIHTLELDSFLISKYPVMNWQFAPYVQTLDDAPPFWGDPKFNQAEKPVVGVSWLDVIDYCGWLSAQFDFNVAPPIDYQWQRAAQGDTDWKYPWGNRFQHDLANTSERLSSPTPVHHYPQGASPFGVMDMSGNVWEWCYIDQDLFGDAMGSMAVLCGGGWLNYEMFATVHARNIRLPNMPYNDAGIRLVRLPED